MFMLEKAAREKFQVELGNYLKDKRVAANLTQGQVAETLGLESPQFISNIERGKCAIPMHIMRQLLKKYNMDKNEFLDYIGGLQMNYFRKSLSHKKGSVG
jgi:transcriptional regulator with XRE-family HTH domain